MLDRRSFTLQVQPQARYPFCSRRTAGRLEPAQRLAVLEDPGALTARSERRIFNAALRAETPRIGTFAIDAPTGRLDLCTSIAVGDHVANLTTDANGHYLLSASYTGAPLASAPNGSDGRTDVQPTQITQTPPHAYCIRTDRFLFTSSLGDDVMLQYIFDATAGRADPNTIPFAIAPKGSGPRHIIFHPHGGMLYVNSELDGSVLTYCFEPPSGQLAYVGRTEIMPERSTATPWAADLHITPDGRYIYASERRTSTLAILAVDEATGLLHLADRIVTEEQPRSSSLEASERFIVVAGEKSKHLTLYRIDARAVRSIRSTVAPSAISPLGYCRDALKLSRARPAAPAASSTLAKAAIRPGWEPHRRTRRRLLLPLPWLKCAVLHTKTIGDLGQPSRSHDRHSPISRNTFHNQDA